MGSSLSSKILSAAVVAVALMMVALAFFPVRFWRHPVNDAVYQGFDSNLVYLDRRGNGTTDGLLNITSDALTLTALPGSDPTVDLVTSPLSFSATMNARVQAGSPGSSLSVGIWSPTTGSGYYLKFGASPSATVSTAVIVGAIGSTTLIGGHSISDTPLGTYIPGQRYHISMSLDKRLRSIATTINGLDLVPFTGLALREGDTTTAEEARSQAIPVVAGRQYRFGGWVDYLGGSQPYSIGVLWSDKQGNLLPFDNWWRDPSDLNGWTRRDLEASAPAAATKATIFVGSGGGSPYLFGHMYLEDAIHPDVNLLSNGDFAEGGKGWTTCQPPGNCAKAAHALQIVVPLPLAARTSVDASQFPELFAAFRPTLTVSMAGGSATTSATIDRYSVTLPSQPGSVAELVEKIDDGRARLLTVLLGVLGGLLCVVGVARWGMPRLRSLRQSDPQRASRLVYVPLWPLWFLSGSIIAYLALNGFLFHLGTPHFDTYTPKLWSYVAAQYSYLELYHRSFLIPAATAQGGIPSHEASFPYGPTKLYYYLGIGWIYRLIFSPPGLPVVDAFQYEVLLKSFNVMFALADALLIHRIVTGLGVRPSTARVTVALFVLNPALMFIMSIWGSTETVSIFFMLLSVWLAQKNYPMWAWVALIFGAFTRPQMMVLAFLLGCVYLRRFAPTANVVAIAWSTIMFFLVLTPVSLAISPTVPVDYVTHILGFQVGTGQADAFSAISPGYYSIWTLPLLYANGQHGIYRMWYPRTTELLGSINYAQASAGLVIVFLVLVGVLILLRSPGGSLARHLPLVAFGMFGWLMFMDSLISRYFLYGLVLIVLCPYAFRKSYYFVIVGWLSFVIFVSAWSHFGLDVFGYHAALNPLNPATNSLTRSVQTLFFNDQFITAGTTANILALMGVGIAAWRGVPPTLSRREPEPSYAMRGEILGGAGS